MDGSHRNAASSRRYTAVGGSWTTTDTVASSATSEQTRSADAANMSWNSRRRISTPIDMDAPSSAPSAGCSGELVALDAELDAAGVCLPAAPARAGGHALSAVVLRCPGPARAAPAATAVSCLFGGEASAFCAHLCQITSPETTLSARNSAMDSEMSIALAAPSGTGSSSWAAAAVADMPAAPARAIEGRDTRWIRRRGRGMRRDTGQLGGRAGVTLCFPFVVAFRCSE